MLPAVTKDQRTMVLSQIPQRTMTTFRDRKPYQSQPERRFLGERFSQLSGRQGIDFKATGQTV
jgi:hypothetical protein